MGPRSWDRGEHRRANAGELIDRAFNGAAVLGPRRENPRHHARRQRRAFNGAAVLGPRRDREQGAGVWTEGILQWGRGLGTAESRPQAGVAGPGPGPSMGPRSWDRGERHRHRHAVADQAAFNGAAVLGPRREEASEERTTPQRPFNGAPVLGPRRGTSSHRAGASITSLQWGRGLGTAESQLAFTLPIASMAFNGAAVLGPRRAASGGQLRRRRIHPSMGPRSWDRGERSSPPRRSSSQIPSMGPRSWDRGEQPSLHSRQRQGLTFNGAAVLGPRRGGERGGGHAPARARSIGPRVGDPRGRQPRRAGTCARRPPMGP